MAQAVDIDIEYQADTTPQEWLVNDWDIGEETYKNVQGEYTVALQETGFYGVQLLQVARRLSGNRKSIAVIPSGGGAELVRVPDNVAPGAGQYRMSPLPTGRLQFSAAQTGQSYVIKYVSSGTVNSRAGIDTIIHDTLDAFSEDVTDEFDRVDSYLSTRIPLGWEFITKPNSWNGNGKFPRAVAAGGGVIVVCCQDTNAKIYSSSDDGLTWNERTNPMTGAFILACKYSGGLFVACGTGGIITSPDGVNWTQRSSVANLTSVRFLNSQWIAVGSAGAVVTSSNGTSWTTQTPPTSVNMYDVAYGAGLLCMTGHSGAPGEVWTSSNGGVSWTSRTITNQQELQGIAFGNGYFVIVGYDLTNSRTGVWTSADGITWTINPMMGRENGGAGWVCEFGNGIFLYQVLGSSGVLNFSASPQNGFFQAFANIELAIGDIFEITFDPIAKKFYAVGVGTLNDQFLLRSSLTENVL